MGLWGFGAAWAGFVPSLARWIEVSQSRGADAVRQVSLDRLGGRVAPNHGPMRSLASWIKGTTQVPAHTKAGD